MYIQSHAADGQGGIALPRDYHGSAFAKPANAVPQSPPEEIAPQNEAKPTSEQEAPPTAEALCHKEERPQGSPFLTRLPFLSSLLPPARHEGSKSGLPEWGVALLVIFLLLGDNRRDSNDLLPLMLLLLLWD